MSCLEQLKDVIQDLYQIMVQVSAYDLTGRPSKDVLEHAVYVSLLALSKSSNSPKRRIQLQRSLQKVHSTSSSPAALTQLPSIPPELIQYVDTGRNPDIYTREFVERTRKMNQTMKGKMTSFGDFRDVLATEMARALPELRDDVGMVVESTGGDKEKIIRDAE